MKDIPNSTREGFADWLRYIEQAANSPVHELSAGDYTKSIPVMLSVPKLMPA